MYGNIVHNRLNNNKKNPCVRNYTKIFVFSQRIKRFKWKQTGHNARMKKKWRQIFRRSISKMTRNKEKSEIKNVDKIEKWFKLTGGPKFRRHKRM